MIQATGASQDRGVPVVVLGIIIVIKARHSRHPQALRLAACATAIAAAAPARAAPGDWVRQVVPIAAPAESHALPLPVSARPAVAATEGWAQQTPDQRLVYNVTQPALIPVPGSLTASTVAPAIILVPGGGFEFLAMDNEGYDVARRLDRLGVRVFIVKYRTLPVAGGFTGFRDLLVQTFALGKAPVDITQDLTHAAADTQAAIRMVRDHAREWHVDPVHVGILGFSAGAMTVLATMQANAPDARPDFAGMIYGPTQTTTVPAKAPPLSAAIAADDRFFAGNDLGLIDGWRKSGAAVEFHLYGAGGHGFASHPNGTTSDAWFDQFALWLKMQKIVTTP